MQPAVVNRKVRGGNRTWEEAWALDTLLSVIRTGRQQGRDPVSVLAELLCSLEGSAGLAALPLEQLTPTTSSDCSRPSAPPSSVRTRTSSRHG